jgi:hypothetical protein
MIEEIWKDIPEYDGAYQVSNLGNVRSFKNSRNGIITEPRFLKKCINSYGYLYVPLFKDRKTKTFKVHQLVAIVFLGHNPNGYKIIIDHINNIKTDNRVENLQLTTARHNTSKDKKNKTSKYVGVSFDKKNKKWLTNININNRSINLGRYKCEIAAASAYQKALKQIQP